MLRREGVPIAAIAGRYLYQHQFFDVARHGGLSNLYAFLPQRLRQFLLGFDNLMVDNLLDARVTRSLH